MKKNTHHDLMTLAVDKARETMNQNIGGPFGALIIDKDGQVLSVASNSVLKDHDPTAHAEMNAIRLATQKLGTHDLSGCVLYTTAYPCPMCLGAIIWSNIKKVYYGCNALDADEIGFRDEFIYEFIKNNAKDKSILDLEEQERVYCLKLFKEYQDMNKELY
jgi:guanine deaminase